MWSPVDGAGLKISPASAQPAIASPPLAAVQTTGPVSRVVVDQPDLRDDPFFRPVTPGGVTPVFEADKKA